MQYNNAGALAGSANLTFDGTTLTAAGLAGPHNGTVGATTPNTGAFTTLAASGTVTFSGGTANGVAYLNGSKVLTTGSALTFDGTLLAFPRLGQSGSGNYGYFNTTGAGNGFLSFQYNSSEVGEIGQGSGIISGGSNTDFGIRATNNLVFGISYNEQMRLTSTGLLIGTTTADPNWAPKLNVTSTATDGTGGIVIESYKPNLIFRDNSAGAQRRHIFADGGNQYFGYGDASITTQATLDSSGNLGLGVTPSAWNSIYKAMQFGPTGAVYSSSGNDSFFSNNTFWNSANSPRYLVNAAATYYYQNAGAHTWAIAPSGTAGNAITFTQAMTLDSSGNLQVGVISGSGRGNFAGPTNTTAGQIGGTVYIRDTTSATGVAGLSGIAMTSGPGTDFRIGKYWSGSGAPRFVIGDSAAALGTDFVSVDSNGNFLVGVTSGSQHRFYKDINNDQAMYVYNTNSSSPFGIYIAYPNVTPNGTGSYFISCQDSSANRMRVNSNGGIANYQANDINLSDRREKTNFAPAGNYLAKVCAIPVQTFNYIDQNMEEDGGLTLGVVAQDVQAVAPELVMESNWGTKEDPKMRLSIYQTDLQYALMKALQELKAEFDAYKASHP